MLRVRVEKRQALYNSIRMGSHKRRTGKLEKCKKMGYYKKAE